VRRVTVEQLAESPLGCYVAGKTYAHFCAAPTLWGVLLWGRPDEAEAIALGKSLVVELAAPAVPHASIFDASRVEGVDLGAFQAAGRYLERHEARLARWLSRMALVRPDGLGGAVVAGAFHVLPRPYPAQVFVDAASAFVWLARDDDALADWPDTGPVALAALHADATATPALLAELRALLDGHLDGITVGDVAKRLGSSERSLQRKIAELGTTFQDELADARLRAAKRLLVDGDAPLTSIALEVGFSSLQHFSALFKKRERMSPSAYRRRHR
jgi:AraC-like DNA-binding protein